MSRRLHGFLLPSAIHATLDQEYPGWKLAPVTPQIQQEFKKHRVNHPPSLAAGDFNRDGKRDYAVQIVLTTPGEEEQIIIVFLAGANGYEETILQSMGIDPTSYLWISHKAISETNASAQETLTNHDVLMVLGGPVGAFTAYAYEDEKFREVIPNDGEDPQRHIRTLPSVKTSRYRASDSGRKGRLIKQAREKGTKTPFESWWKAARTGFSDWSFRWCPTASRRKTSSKKFS